MKTMRDELEFEALYDLIVGVRDAYPRVPNDAPSEEIAEAIVRAGFRLPRESSEGGA